MSKCAGQHAAGYERGAFAGVGGSMRFNADDRWRYRYAALQSGKLTR
jgi:hypothetical protein